MSLAIWNISADAAIIGIAAAATALIAAITAQLRLRSQLDHDAEMRERDATRAALDAVVTDINAAAAAMIVAGEASRELFNVRSATEKTGMDEGIAEAERDMREAIHALRDLRVPLMAASLRLHLRFPDADPIIGRLAEWRETFEELSDAYESALDSGTMERREKFAAAWTTAKRLGEQLNIFVIEARAWATEPTRSGAQKIGR